MRPGSGAPQAWVVSLTPFDAQGQLDEPAFRSHLQRMARAGIGVYVGSSNAGEGFALSAHERQRLFEIAADEIGGKVPVRAGGCEPQSVGLALEYLKAAAWAGLDAAHLFPLDTGHAGPLKASEVEDYYSRALDACEIPLVISNYPAMGSVLPPDLVGRLAEKSSKLIAVRDAGGDTNYLRELVSICKGKVDVYTGGVRSLATSLLHGSQGFLGAEANLCPSVAVTAVNEFVAGNLAGFRRAHEQLFQLHLLVNKFGGPAGRGMKPLLARLGLPGGTLRPPRTPLASLEVDAMLVAFKGIGLPIDDMSA